MRNGTRPTIISDTKSGTLPEGPLFEIRDLSSEGRHSDGRYQMTGTGLRTSSFRGSEGESRNLPALFSSVSVVRKDILRYASLKPDRLTYSCLRVPIPQPPAPFPGLLLIPAFIPLDYMNREAGRPGDILSFPESAHSMETGTEEPKPSQVSSAAPGAPTMKYPIKTPEERPVRHDGGKYGYTCSSLTTQIFRFGGCSWPIHRSRRPEPNRASGIGMIREFLTWGEKV